MSAPSGVTNFGMFTLGGNQWVSDRLYAALAKGEGKGPQRRANLLIQAWQTLLDESERYDIHKEISDTEVRESIDAWIERAAGEEVSERVWEQMSPWA